MGEFFVSSRFPESWRDVLVRFVPKPSGKGYRVISLTSSIGKLMEMMVHHRLEHFIENRIISSGSGGRDPQLIA